MSVRSRSSHKSERIATRIDLFANFSIKILMVYSQVVPHICNEIQDWISRVAATPTDGQKGSPDICVIELGGTVSKPTIYIRSLQYVLFTFSL